jgi:hypothetical protein
MGTRSRISTGQSSASSWPRALVAEQIDDFINVWRHIAADAVRAEHRLEAIRPSPRQHDLTDAFQWCRRVALNAVRLGLAAAACLATPTLANRLALARYDLDPPGSELLALPAPDLAAAIMQRLEAYDHDAGAEILASFPELLRELDKAAPRARALG